MQTNDTLGWDSPLHMVNNFFVSDIMYDTSCASGQARSILQRLYMSMSPRLRRGGNLGVLVATVLRTRAHTYNKIIYININSLLDLLLHTHA